MTRRHPDGVDEMDSDYVDQRGLPVIPELPAPASLVVLSSISRDPASRSAHQAGFLGGFLVAPGPIVDGQPYTITRDVPSRHYRDVLGLVGGRWQGLYVVGTARLPVAG